MGGNACFVFWILRRDAVLCGTVPRLRRLQSRAGTGVRTVPTVDFVISYILYIAYSRFPLFSRGHIRITLVVRYSASPFFPSRRSNLNLNSTKYYCYYKKILYNHEADTTLLKRLVYHS